MGLSKLSLVVKSLFIPLFVSLVLAVSAIAAPQILNYQGNLSQDGQPVTATKTMVFRIYAEADDTPAEALWVSGEVSVAVSNGVFSVTLGDAGQTVFPANLFDDDTRYLGITVDGAELTERKRLASVPYALSSAIPKGGIIMWSGSVATIPTGWVLCDGQNGTPDLRNKFMIGAGSNYSVSATGGEATHTLTVSEMPSHTHTQNAHTHLTNDPGHTHDIDFYSSDENDPVGGNREFSTDYRGTINHYTKANKMFAVSKTTGISINNATAVNQNTGGGAAHNNLPPYYALCFIMKL